jgi:Fur family transcriptional regulator, ferric uptake regulator
MASSTQLADLLKQHGLKKTPARMMVLELLHRQHHAIGYTEIEQQVKAIADRVTLYRLLISFEEEGIIHKTFDQNGTPKYALCHNGCSHGHHRDEHLHFNCISCKQTYCMDEIEIPKLNLPKGFAAQSYQFAITGTCKSCKN